MTSVSPAVSVSTRIAQFLSQHVTDIFGVMGNGNAFFLDAAEHAGMTFHAVRHEGASVAAADAYYRVSGRLAAATTTYGPGFTNAVTGLAEAVQAQIPVLLVTGDSPGTGPRPWDVDQLGIAAAVAAPTYTATRETAATVTAQAIQHALEHRTAVVLSIPYDIAAAPAAEEAVPPPVAVRAPVVPDPDVVRRAAAILSTAKRPLIVSGRGAHLAGAGQELRFLADTLGALTAGTALARNLLAGDGDLGIAGGFGTEESSRFMAEADVVLVAGARLNQFTMRFGQLVNDAATVIQVDIAGAPTHPRVDLFVNGDARETARAITTLLPRRDEAATWRKAAAPRLAATRKRHPGVGLAGDGRLDPRSVAAALNEVLPVDRVVVQDGGHFIGWAPMYWDIAGPQSLSMVGTAFQTIGLGLASAVGAAAAVPESTVVLSTGDGGLLMALADLESVARTVRSGVIVVFNDAAYGAEIHQYGVQGITVAPMLIPDVDFAGLARAFGAQGATIRSLQDLDSLRDWVTAGARGVFLADCRVSSSIRAPYMVEIVEAAARARNADKEPVGTSAG